MVYLITSNTQKVGPGTSTSGLNDPTSYVNMLSQTFNIEKDSEIAVESLKITRNGNLQVSGANNQFGIYIGDDLSIAGGEKSDVLENHLGWVNKTIITGGNITKSPFSLTTNIREGLLRGLGQHPNFVTIDTNYPKVELKNASNEFTGFKYSFKQNLSGAKTHIPAVAGQGGWVATSSEDINAEISSSGTTGVVIKAVNLESASGMCSVIGQKYPINQANGSVVFRYNSSLSGSAGIQWECGLTRATFNNLQTGGADPLPLKFDRETDVPYVDFFDYSVVQDGTTLKAYWWGWNDETDEFEEILIGVGEKTAATYHSVKFEVNNDAVKISLIKVSDNSEEVWVDSGEEGGDKDDWAKPVGISNFYLYPKVFIKSSDVLGNPYSASRMMVVTDYDGLNIPTYNYRTQLNGSFQYGGVHSTGVLANASRVLLGEKMDMEHHTYQDFWASAYTYAFGHTNLGTVYRQEQRGMLSYQTEDGGQVVWSPFNGLNASGGVDRDIVLVMAPSTLYNATGNVEGYGGGWTDEFGAQNVLGFENMPPQSINTYVSAAQGNLVVLESKTVPKMVSNKSLFVRLPDLPINSFNSGKGSVSKILYHMPRFDNSGNEVGGLYYQPHERLYIPFENTEAIRLNNLKVELCNIDETTGSVDLVGQTIICFDIRKRRQ